MISFVFFDLGGVVIKDFSASDKWQHMQQDLGITASHQKAFDQLWLKYRDEICVTRDVDSLIPILNQELALNISPGYSMLEDFVARFEPNPSIWPLVKKLKLTVKVGLLTNLYPGMFNKIKQAQLLPTIAWDIIIDSSVEKLQKPNPKLYALAQKRAGVSPNQIFFVDNTQSHLDVAAKLGWKTFWYDSRNYQKSSQQLSQFLNA